MRIRKVLVGAGLFNWSETQRMVYISEKLIERGIEVMFIGEGKYDYLLNNLQCKRKTLYIDKKWFVKDRIERMMNLDIYGNDYATCKEIEEVVSQEVQVMKEYKPDLVLTGYRTTFTVSARVAKIPLAWCLSAVVSPMFFELGLATIPSDVKINHFLSNIKDPEQKKKYFAKFASMNALSNNKTSTQWNMCLKKFGLPEFNSDMSIFEGDINFMSDAFEFFEEFKDKKKTYSFCGPFRPRDEDMVVPEWLKNYTKKDSKVILIMMGSSGTKEILTKVLDQLKELVNYDFFIATLSNLTEEEEKKYPANFYFAEKYPIREVLDKVDGCVIHGGQGTMYSVAFAGKPLVGIPMFNEQEYNLSNMTRKFKNGIVVLKKDIMKESAKTAVEKIMTDQTYFDNAKNVKKLLEKYTSDQTIFAETVVADKIIEYIKGN